MRDIGPLLVVVGLVFVIVGLLAWSGALGWFGRLPGDIRITGAHFHFYIPITSMILLSIVLTVLLSLIQLIRR